jgi:transcriptional regulator with XRE-family HTH domain
MEMEKVCAEKLRELRRQRGLTLDEFSKLSGGRIKSVVLGSYERGTRAISIAKLQLVAEIYQVPIQYFFGVSASKSEVMHQRWIIDLRRLKISKEGDSFAQLVISYVGHIVQRRNDFNGEVISLRTSDQDNLSLITRAEKSDVREALYLRGILYGAKN